MGRAKRGDPWLSGSGIFTLNRFPDASVIDLQTGKTVKVYEAARFEKDGTLVRPDEVAKIADYEAAGIPYECHPVGPNKPPGGVLKKP